MSRLLSVFNPAGMLFAAALLAPYIFFFKRYPGEGERCPNKAIFRNEAGLADVDHSVCLTCGYCAPVCPVRAIIMW